MGIKSYIRQQKDNSISVTDVDDRYSIEEYNYQRDRIIHACYDKKGSQMPTLFVIGSMRAKNDPASDLIPTLVGFAN